jgi:hypothetical protein
MGPPRVTRPSAEWVSFSIGSLNLLVLCADAASLTATGSSSSSLSVSAFASTSAAIRRNCRTVEEEQDELWEEIPEHLLVE